MPEPKYQQIAHDLEVKIQNGELLARPVDPRLPHGSDLPVGYSASGNTVRGAIKLLNTRVLINVGAVPASARRPTA